jgi:CubicO group peptidase (beta-lactamase class C family)
MRGWVKFAVAGSAVLAAGAPVAANALREGAPRGPALPKHGDARSSLAAGKKATLACSSIFLARRQISDVIHHELATPASDVLGVSELPDPVVDRRTRSVSVAYATGEPPRVAAYREDAGCTVLPPGWRAEDVRKLPTVERSDTPGDPARLPWPEGDRLEAEPAPGERLSQVVDAAFDAETYGANSKTLGVVVVHRGQIVAEKYAPGFDKDTQYRTWSTSKSFVNALIGVLVRQGKLRLDQPVPVPEWEGDPRAKIKIEDLLHMSSGLRTIVPDDGTNTNRAYWGGIDTAADVIRQPPVAEPGTRWHYSNYDSLLLVRAMKQVIGDQDAYLRFPWTELFDKLGMRHTVTETDPYGNFVMSSQSYTTPRDLARFGLLYLHDGVWDGERILPEGWVKYAEQQAPADEAKEYGAHFWRTTYTDGEREEGIPDGTFNTSGRHGQYAVVVPARDMVIVRTGLDPAHTTPSYPFYLKDFVRDVIAAAG